MRIAGVRAFAGGPAGGVAGPVISPNVGPLAGGTTVSFPAACPTEPNIVQTGIGQFHTVVLSSDGGVYAWGRNNYGRLGVGDKTIRPTPVQVTGFRPWHG